MAESVLAVAGETITVIGKGIDPVDRLPAGQVEALYVLLRGMVPGAAESLVVANDAPALDDWRPSPDAPVVRTLSIVGIAEGDHDLGARSEEILRRELG